MAVNNKALEEIAKLDYMWRFCGVPDEYEAEWENETECIKQNCRAFACEILSISKIAIVDRNALLPIRFLHPDDKPNVSYGLAQKDMVENGWVREISGK